MLHLMRQRLPDDAALLSVRHARGNARDEPGRAAVEVAIHPCIGREARGVTIVMILIFGGDGDGRTQRAERTACWPRDGTCAAGEA